MKLIDHTLYTYILLLYSPALLLQFAATSEGQLTQSAYSDECARVRCIYIFFSLSLLYYSSIIFQWRSSSIVHHYYIYLRRSMRACSLKVNAYIYTYPRKLIRNVIYSRATHHAPRVLYTPRIERYIARISFVDARKRIYIYIYIYMYIYKLPIYIHGKFQRSITLSC